MSAVDRLTGVFNRAAFDRQLTEEADRARRYARPFAVAILDIDHFKRVNDTHGTRRAMPCCAAWPRPRRAVRKSDMVARYGGEEFAVVLPENNAELVIAKLEVLRRAVGEAKMTLGKRRRSIGVTVSIGVASWPDDGSEWTTSSRAPTSGSTRPSGAGATARRAPREPAAGSTTRGASAPAPGTRLAGIARLGSFQPPARWTERAVRALLPVCWG